MTHLIPLENNELSFLLWRVNERIIEVQKEGIPEEDPSSVFLWKLWKKLFDTYHPHVLKKGEQENYAL